MDTQKIIIVGAGLCGSLLALRLAQRGFNISLYEKRSDMRLEDEAAGRSINLALSSRGLWALEKVGLKETIMDACIPMKGRMIHPLGDEPFMSKYSGRPEHFINSVSRSGLNILLLDEADKFDNIQVYFDSKVNHVDLENASISFIDKNGNTQKDDGTIVIGTDGAGSVVRQSLMGQSPQLLFNYSQDFLRHGYKELSILPDSDGGWKIEKEALHIWPRGHFMIIALPNLDGSFTLTMFHPFGSDIGFDNLKDEAAVQDIFENNFPTLLPLIPHYKEEFFSNPVGTLGTIKCYPWQANGKVLIMGDAAHAVVPFYGQGMNASFEDVRIFDDLMDEYGDNWLLVFKAFQDARTENTDAIADLAIDNFYEMRDRVDDELFIRKRKIEMQLEEKYPEYYSKYSMVTFKPEMPYAAAKKLGRKQDELLLELCNKENYTDIPIEKYFEQIQNIRL